MRTGTPSGPNICAVCKRKKDTAVREQVEQGSPCGHNGCTFDKEIKSALLARNKIKILPPLIKTKHKIRILPPVIPKKNEKDG